MWIPLQVKPLFFSPSAFPNINCPKDNGERGTASSRCPEDLMSSEEAVVSWCLIGLVMVLQRIRYSCRACYSLCQDECFRNEAIWKIPVWTALQVLDAAWRKPSYHTNAYGVYRTYCSSFYANLAYQMLQAGFVVNVRLKRNIITIYVFSSAFWSFRKKVTNEVFDLLFKK